MNECADYEFAELDFLLLGCFTLRLMVLGYFSREAVRVRVSGSSKMGTILD